MRITQTEFVRKYNLPMFIVHNASYRIPYQERKDSFGMFDENELFKATEEELQSNIDYYQAKVNKGKERLLNIRIQKGLDK